MPRPSSQGWAPGVLPLCVRASETQEEALCRQECERASETQEEALCRAIECVLPKRKPQKHKRKHCVDKNEIECVLPKRQPQKPGNC